MQLMKFREETINGADESTIEWTEVTGKDELMIEIFTSEHLFEDLSSYWKNLEKRVNAPIYISYEWVYHWWKHFGRNEQRSLFIITVWDGTKLIAVAPFYKGYSAFGSLKLETRLQLIGSGGYQNEQLGYLIDDNINDSLDFLVDPSYATHVADRLVEDVMTHGFLGADVVKLHRVGEDSFVMDFLIPRLESRFPEMNIRQSDIRRYIDLEEESLKANLKMLQSKIADQNFVIEDGNGCMQEVEEVAERFILQSRKNWNQLELAGLFNERVAAFLKDILKYALKNDWIQLKRVRNGEDVYADHLLLKYNRRYYEFISRTKEDLSTSKYLPYLLADLLRNGIVSDIQRIELKDSEAPDLRTYHVVTSIVRISMRKRRRNIPWLLNRIGAYLYKFAGQLKWKMKY